MSDSRFARILIAVDGSDRAAHVLEQGFSLARSVGASVVVLRCVGLPVDLGHEILGRTPADIERDLIRAADAGTSELVARYGAGIPSRIRIEIGTAAQTILRIASEDAIDLVVVGAHGYRWSERVLGTTASRVVDRAECSVLVVR